MDHIVNRTEARLGGDFGDFESWVLLAGCGGVIEGFFIIGVRGANRDPHSVPARRSSDLSLGNGMGGRAGTRVAWSEVCHRIARITDEVTDLCIGDAHIVES